MNKELLNERKDNDLKLNELQHFITAVEDFLKKSGQYYQKEESLEALKNIKEVLIAKQSEYDTLRKRQHIVKRSLVESCNHEIIFGDDLNTFCCLCKTLIINIPETTKLKIYLSGSWEDPLIKSDDEFNGKYTRSIISELAEKYIDNEDLDEILEAFEELQYHVDIKTRRLKP